MTNTVWVPSKELYIPKDVPENFTYLKKDIFGEAGSIHSNAERLLSDVYASDRVAKILSLPRGSKPKHIREQWIGVRVPVIEEGKNVMTRSIHDYEAGNLSVETLPEALVTSSDAAILALGFQTLDQIAKGEMERALHSYNALEAWIPFFYRGSALWTFFPDTPGVTMNRFIEIKKVQVG